MVTFIAAKTDHDAVLNLAAGGFVAVLPLATGLAVAKTRLYDVDRILSRVVSYGLLSAVLAGTYAGVVLLVGQGVGGAAGSSTVAVALATLAVVSLARPAHRTLQDTVDRRFSRRRYDALGMLRAHVASPDPTTTVEQVLRDALRDQNLSVSYWVQDQQVWVTGDGRVAMLPARALTCVVVAGLSHECRQSRWRRSWSTRCCAKPNLSSTTRGYVPRWPFSSRTCVPPGGASRPRTWRSGAESSGICTTAPSSGCSPWPRNSRQRCSTAARNGCGRR